MTINELFKLHLGKSISILHKPFIYVGHAQIDLDGDASVRWLYDDETGMFCVSPEDEELVLFHEIEDDLEPDGDSIFFNGKEYEFSYEDAGVVAETEGESVAEADDRYLFTDYQSAEGEIIRLVNNENSGEKLVYVGKYVSEDDVAEL